MILYSSYLRTCWKGVAAGQNLLNIEFHQVRSKIWVLHLGPSWYIEKLKTSHKLQHDPLIKKLRVFLKLMSFYWNKYWPRSNLFFCGLIFLQIIWNKSVIFSDEIRFQLDFTVNVSLYFFLLKNYGCMKYKSISYILSEIWCAPIRIYVSNNF